MSSGQGRSYRRINDTGPPSFRGHHMCNYTTYNRALIFLKGPRRCFDTGPSELVVRALKTCRVEELMHIKSVDAQNPSVVVDTPENSIHLWVPSHRRIANDLNEKECRPVVTKTYPGGYPPCQSDKSIYRFSIWYTRRGEGLLSQRTNGVGMETRRAVCRSITLTNQIIGGVKEALPGFLKGRLIS
ncbi:hypothetical protein TNCV_2612951 [Trichonephila clavipes]|nr:hypothetical protein TNCV_2612951 [Trichonephila clavipes]